MVDVNDREQTEPSSAERRSEREVAGGLEENVAGVLTYLLGFVAGLLFYFVEAESEFVRFHAVQSTIVFGALLGVHVVLMTVSAVLVTVPFVGWLIALGIALVQTVIGLVTSVLWLALMLKAYQGERWSLPVAGSMAEKRV